MARNLNPPTSATTAQGRTLDSLVNQGDPAAMLRVTGAAADAVSPGVQFGSAVMELLKRYQGVEKFPYMEQGLNAEQEQATRLGAQTPRELIGASPGIQSAVRGASVGAVEPTISGASRSGQTFSSQLAGLGELVTTFTDLYRDDQTRQAEERRFNAEMRLKREELELEREKLSRVDPIDALNLQLKQQELQEATTKQEGAGVLKEQALTSARELLSKLTEGRGTSAVGRSRIFGLQKIPGTDPRDFEVQFNNLKSLLSLDNVKYLKGQGQVSDAERRLLSEASSKLDLSQSEEEFQEALLDIVAALSGLEKL